MVSYLISTLTVEHTLKVCARRPDAVLGWHMSHVADLDLTLCLNYWKADSKTWDWEPVSATVEGIEVTPESDPDLWKIIQRGVTKSFSDLDGVVQDLIGEREWQ